MKHSNSTSSYTVQRELAMDSLELSDHNKSAESDSAIWMMPEVRLNAGAPVTSSARKAKSIETLAAGYNSSTGCGGGGSSSSIWCTFTRRRQEKLKHSVATHVVSVGSTMATPIVSVTTEYMDSSSCCADVNERHRQTVTAGHTVTDDASTTRVGSVTNQNSLAEPDHTSGGGRLSRSMCDVSKCVLTSSSSSSSGTSSSSLTQKLNNALLRFRRKSFTLESRKQKAVWESTDDGLNGRYSGLPTGLPSGLPSDCMLPAAAGPQVDDANDAAPPTSQPLSASCGRYCMFRVCVACYPVYSTKF